jgi:hypothetical protein
MYFYGMKLKHGSSTHIDPSALLLKTAKRFFRAFLWQST